MAQTGLGKAPAKNDSLVRLLGVTKMYKQPDNYDIRVLDDINAALGLPEPWLSSPRFARIHGVK